MSLCLTESLAGQPDRKDLTTEGSAVPVTVVVPEEHVVAFVSVVSGTATAASPDPDSHSPGQRGAEFSGRHHVIFSQISSGHQGFHHWTPVQARSKGNYGVNGGGPGTTRLDHEAVWSAPGAFQAGVVGPVEEILESARHVAEVLGRRQEVPVSGQDIIGHSVEREENPDINRHPGLSDDRRAAGAPHRFLH